MYIKILKELTTHKQQLFSLQVPQHPIIAVNRISIPTPMIMPAITRVYMSVVNLV